MDWASKAPLPDLRGAGAVGQRSGDFCVQDSRAKGQGRGGGRAGRGRGRRTAEKVRGDYGARSCAGRAPQRLTQADRLAMPLVSMPTIATYSIQDARWRSASVNPSPVR